MKTLSPDDALLRGERGGEQLDEAVIAQWERERPPIALRVVDGKVVAGAAATATRATRP